MEKCSNRSVGAIIQNDGKFLLIDRVNPPYGWAGVAGHIEEGQTPEEALVAEVSEEVRLMVISHKLVIEEMVPWNNCRRSNGEGHYWYVYKVDVDESDQIEAEEDEVKEFGWFTPEEMQYLELEPVWRYWFEKLGYISPANKSEGE